MQMPESVDAATWDAAPSASALASAAGSPIDDLSDQVVVACPEIRRRTAVRGVHVAGIAAPLAVHHVRCARVDREHAFALGTDHHVAHAGHRLAVDVAGEVGADDRAAVTDLVAHDDEWPNHGWPPSGSVGT